MYLHTYIKHDKEALHAEDCLQKSLIMRKWYFSECTKYRSHSCIIESLLELATFYKFHEHFDSARSVIDTIQEVDIEEAKKLLPGDGNPGIGQFEYEISVEEKIAFLSADIEVYQRADYKKAKVKLKNLVEKISSKLKTSEGTDKHETFNRRAMEEKRKLAKDRIADLNKHKWWKVWKRL